MDEAITHQHREGHRNLQLAGVCQQAQGYPTGEVCRHLGVERRKCSIEIKPPSIRTSWQTLDDYRLCYDSHHSMDWMGVHGMKLQST